MLIGHIIHAPWRWWKALKMNNGMGERKYKKKSKHLCANASVVLVQIAWLLSIQYWMHYHAYI